VNEGPEKGRASSGGPPYQNRASTRDGTLWQAGSVLGLCSPDRKAVTGDASRLVCIAVSGARARSERREKGARREDEGEPAKARAAAPGREQDRGGGRARRVGTRSGYGRPEGAELPKRRVAAIVWRAEPRAAACGVVGCRRKEPLYETWERSRGTHVLCERGLLDRLHGALGDPP
jgi:hypothetical protein